MARPVTIDQYQPQVPVEEGLRRIIPQSTGVSTGPAFEELGSSVNRVAQSEAAVYVAKNLSDAQSQWTQQLQDRQEKAQPGAPGFTPSLMKDYSAYVQDAVKNAPNTLAGKLLSMHLGEFGNHLQTQALGFEANARHEDAINTAQTSVDAASNQLMTDPSQFNQRVAERLSLIDAMNIDPQMKDKLHKYATTQMAKAATQADIQTDPRAAQLELLSSNPTKPYTQYLQPQEREQLINAATVQVHQRIEDAERLERLQDKQERETAQTALTQMIVKSTKGALTMGDIRSMAPLFNHDPAGLEAAMRLVNEEKEGKTDPRVFLPMLHDAMQGRDMYDELSHHIGRDVSKTDAAHILELGDKGLPNALRQGEDYVNNAMKPGAADKYNPVVNLSHAQALDSYYSWSRQNPNATAEESTAKARELVSTYALIDLSKSKAALPMEPWIVGNRTNVDPDASAAAVAAAEKSGTIDHAEAIRRMGLVSQWRSAIERSRTIQAPAAPK